MLRQPMILTALARTAGAFALVVSFSGAAKADLEAYAQLSITNFQFFNNDTGEQLDQATDFDLINIGNTSTASADLNGASAGPASIGPVQGGSDVPLQCVGDCGGFAQNEFNRTGLGGTAASFSRGDALLAGSTLANAGVANSATAQSVAELNLLAEGVGTAAGEVSTGTVFSFTPNSDIVVRLDFNALPELIAGLTAAAEFGPSIALAGLSWSITLTEATPDGGVVFEWAPNGQAGGIEGGTELADPDTLNTSRTTLLPGVQASYLPGAGFYSALTPLLTGGTAYFLSIQHTTNVEGRLGVVQIPEPTTLSLFSGGLLLLGLVGMWSRRRTLFDTGTE